VPRLADLGVYIASESSFYRALKQHDELHHRARTKVRRQRKHTLTTHQANHPKELWSWDITYLPSRIKGCFFYLYMIIDVFSRKIVGYEVYEQELGQFAAKLMERTVIAEQICQTKKPLILHQDNGAPMKSYTFKAKLEELGIVSSYSRPRVSDDNPYIESLFRTLKYSQLWPSKGFEDLTQARQWVQHFVHWYNQEHRHSKIGFITPHQKHTGQSDALMKNRTEVYQAAKNKHPSRWSGQIRNWESTQTVFLNPEKSVQKDGKTAA
jgi:putative transposase